MSRNVISQNTAKCGPLMKVSVSYSPGSHNNALYRTPPKAMVPVSFTVGRLNVAGNRG